MNRGKIPTVKRVMTAFPYSIDVDAPLREARVFMQDKDIRHLPVRGAGQELGMITDRDIKRMLGPDMDYPPEQELCVRDAYDAAPLVVELDTPLDLVLRAMADRHVSAALVTRRGDLAGMFTATDAFRAFARFLSGNPLDGGEAA